jgi:hypothetical protein
MGLELAVWFLGNVTRSHILAPANWVQVEQGRVGLSGPTVFTQLLCSGAQSCSLRFPLLFHPLTGRQVEPLKSHIPENVSNGKNKNNLNLLSKLDWSHQLLRKCPFRPRK